MIEASDESIIKNVQAGNAEAFGELIARYEPKMRRYASRFLNRSDEIDDMVQDVFIKAYTNIQSFDTSLRFSPWIYRIAHNTFVNELRRKERIGLVFDADTIFPLFSSEETADAETLKNELRQEVETMLSTLPVKYREVMLLHYFHDFSYQEISDILKIPVTTVGVRLRRARQKLQDLHQNLSVSNP